jgi:hypothetical protein
MSEELEAWIGLLVLTGIRQLPECQNYWNGDPLLAMLAVKEVMTSVTYKKIVETVQCNDSSINLPWSHDGHDMLHKVRPIIDKQNQKYVSSYRPSGTVAVDESMTALKGRSSLKQCIPMKPVEWGYKVWCLADSETVFVTSLEVYTGKTTDQAKDVHMLGEKVVLDLCGQVKRDPWTVVVFDNFVFTSVQLP